MKPAISPSAKKVAFAVIAFLMLALFYGFFHLVMSSAPLAFIPLIGCVVVSPYLVYARYKTWVVILSFITTTTWFFYGLWEQYVARKYPPESIPIRVDLLLIFPVLYALTLTVVYHLLFGGRKKRKKFGG